MAVGLAQLIVQTGSIGSASDLTGLVFTHTAFAALCVKLTGVKTVAGSTDSTQVTIDVLKTEIRFTTPTGEDVADPRSPTIDVALTWILAVSLHAYTVVDAVDIPSALSRFGALIGVRITDLSAIAAALNASIDALIIHTSAARVTVGHHVTAWALYTLRGL